MKGIKLHEPINGLYFLFKKKDEVELWKKLRAS